MLHVIMNFMINKRLKFIRFCFNQFFNMHMWQVFKCHNVICNLHVRRPCELLQLPIVRPPTIIIFENKNSPLKVHDEFEPNFDRFVLRVRTFIFFSQVIHQIDQIMAVFNEFLWSQISPFCEMTRSCKRLLHVQWKSLNNSDLF